jgi:mono/diheme cytochrome c family protein
MKLCKLALVSAAALLLVAACNTTSAPPSTNTPAGANTPAAATPAAPPDEFADARKTYAATCSRCHGDKGEGGEFDFDGKPMKAASLREGHALTHDDARLARKISEGGDGMPAFKKRLSAEQIDALVRFIRHDFQSGTTGSNANSATGRPTAPAH